MVAAICADILARTPGALRGQDRGAGLHHPTRLEGRDQRADELDRASAPPPGRLNDLQPHHLQAADSPWRRARKNLGLMMREGLLKENIDGEALDVGAHSA
ncbi:cobaltochelatase CobT-related protein [Caulobacter segnis]